MPPLLSKASRDCDAQRIMRMSVSVLISLEGKVQEIVELSKTTAAFHRSLRQLAFSLVVALSVVTGRRYFEILQTAIVQKVDGEAYQACLHFQLLASDKGTYTKVVKIPLAVSFDVVKAAFEFIKKHILIKSVTTKKLNGDTSKYINQASRRLFGRSLKCTEKQNVYTETCWSNRLENRFFVDSIYCKTEWCKKALGR